MNEPLVTLAGHLGSPVTQRTAGGSPVGDFRLAVQPSWFDRRSQTWVSGEPQWYDVVVWRQLAEHCARSLAVGDPVVVTGRLAQKGYVTKAGAQAVSWEVTATAVGHDLTWGTSTFTKAARPAEGVVETVAA